MIEGRLPSTYAKLWRLLPARFKSAALLLLLGSILGSVLEVLGLALLGLLLSELGSPGAGMVAGVHLSSLPGPWWSGPEGGAMALLVLCGATFLCKNAFMAGHAWLEATLAFKAQAAISARLVGRSLRLGYEAAVKRPPSEYIALLSADLGSLVFHTLLPALTLLSEIVLVGALFVYLAWTQTRVTLIVSAVLSIIGVLLVTSSKRRVSRLSGRRQVLEDARFKQLQHTFANLRDVYVYHAADYHETSLARGMSDLAGVYRGYQMMATGPRFVLEAVMLAVLLSIVAAGLHSQDRSALIASVGVFAASGFRLLIGANRLIMSVQSLRFGSAALDRVSQSLAPEGPAHDRQWDPLPARERDWLELRVRGVSYRYPGESAPCFGPFDLHVRRGEMIGIIGASGAGKSTLLELLAGLRRPHSGAIELADADGLTEQMLGASPRVGLVGQNTALLAGTLRENLAFGLAPADVSDDLLWQALRLAQLDEFARSLPDQLESVIAEYGASLSGGQIQRIGVARALCRNGSFLLLDEPTSALDAKTESELVRTFRQLASRCGIVLVSHRPFPLQECDRVYELRHDGLRLLQPACSK